MRDATTIVMRSHRAAAPDRLLELERQHIIHILKATHGNKSEAARRLGIERKTLYKKAVRSGHQSAVSGRVMTTRAAATRVVAHLRRLLPSFFW